MWRLHTCCMVFGLQVGSFLVAYYGVLKAIVIAVGVYILWYEPWEWYPQMDDATCILDMGHNWGFRIVLIIIALALLSLPPLVILGSRKEKAKILLAAFGIFAGHILMDIVSLILICIFCEDDEIVVAVGASICALLVIIEGLMALILWSFFVEMVEWEMLSSEEDTSKPKDKDKKDKKEKKPKKAKKKK